MHLRRQYIASNMRRSTDSQNRRHTRQNPTTAHPLQNTPVDIHRPFLYWQFIQATPMWTQDLKGSHITPHHVEFVLWTEWVAKTKSGHSMVAESVAAAKGNCPDDAQASAEFNLALLPRKVTFFDGAQFLKDAHTGLECSWCGTYTCFGGASDGRSKWLPLPCCRE